jgi:hypothetical protein
MNGLNFVFHALVLSKLLCGSQVYSNSLLESELDRIQAVLNKAVRWSLATRLKDIRELYHHAGYRPLNKICAIPSHCLSHLLPAKCPAYNLHMQKHGHNYLLLSLHKALHKIFICTHCLFVWFCLVTTLYAVFLCPYYSFFS